MMRLLRNVCVSAAMLLLSAGAITAQKVTFDVNAPAVVAAEEIFRVEFAVNARPEQFTPPAFSGFEILAGPSESTGHSVQIVNGNITQSTNVTYTYVLQGLTAGNFTLPSASVVVDGKTYQTKPFPIEVIAGGGSGQTPGQQQGQQQSQPTATIGSDDIFLRAIVDRSNVFKGQPIRLTFKIYTNQSLIGSEGVKVPAFNGFWMQDITPQNRSWQRESHNNRIYETQVIAEYLLYPQQAGTLTIEQMDLSIVAQIITPSRRQSIFDDFFGGGADVQEVRKSIRSSPVRITVRELPPGAPAGFTGAVGKFSLETNVSSSNIPANSGGNYTIRIAGTGNLPLISAPRLTLPSSFEQYTVKTTESLNTNSSGISGYRQFEYPFIVRAEGNYTIDPVEFSYFNPDLAKYVTLHGHQIEMTILPDSSTVSSSARGIVSGMSKEEIKILGEDIRFIKLGTARFAPTSRIFMASGPYFVLVALILSVFAFALVYLQKRIKESRNVALMRGKRANKVVLQRLRTAEKHLKADDRRAFYDEILHAVWGYIGDKLNIPAANLNKENVREELLRRGISQAQAERFIDLICACEYAQYSPDVSGRMNKLYQDAVQVISKLESSIKR